MKPVKPDRPALDLRLVAIAGIVISLVLPGTAFAERVSLSGLQQKIEELEARLDAMTDNPCPPGEAIVAFQPDGTPSCVAFATRTVEFSFDFVSGQNSNAACPIWKFFIEDAASLTHSEISFGGTLGAPISCSNPVAVNQILANLVVANAGPRTSGNGPTVQCDGFNWTVSNACGGIISGETAPALTVSPIADPIPVDCQCQQASSNVYVIRPCIGNLNWGGAGTNVCNAQSQTMSVTAQ